MTAPVPRSAATDAVCRSCVLQMRAKTANGTDAPNFGVFGDGTKPDGKERADPIADDPYLCTARLIKYTYTSIVRGIDQRVQVLKLTAKQWEPLLLLSLERADTMVGLAQYIGMDFGGMTRI